MVLPSIFLLLTLSFASQRFPERNVSFLLSFLAAKILAVRRLYARRILFAVTLVGTTLVLLMLATSVKHLLAQLLCAKIARVRSLVFPSRLTFFQPKLLGKWLA